MYKIPANTLFMGKNLVFVPECRSTNTLALEISQQSPVKEGTVVITDHQTAGKGQRGNVWESEAGKNLTFSLVIKPGFLPINKQFFLNIVVCLAVREYLSHKLPGNLYIKWPNDILVHEKKICGVLIENQLQGSMIAHAVAGVGLNVNQRTFEVPTATSMALISGRDFTLEEELPLLLEALERRYLQLRASHDTILMDAYLDALYRRGEMHRFSSGEKMFEGKITGLDPYGRLQIEVADEIRTFDIKQIRYH